MDNYQEQNVGEDNETENIEIENIEESSKRPVVFRILAFFTFLIFLGFVVYTSWPGLTLPSLDFIARSVKLNENPSISQLKKFVVRIDAVSTSGSAAGAQKVGTGFNISSNGLIVTNRHVISGAKSIDVTFPDGKIHTARGQKSLPDVDLALIYLDARDLPAAELSTEKEIKPGEKVIIIGNPLGIGSVTMEGKVTGYSMVSGCPSPALLIDAPVQPGHSGSPVFDESGKVVGVVFGSVSGGEGSKQQGAAIPVKDVVTLLGSGFTL